MSKKITFVLALLCLVGLQLQAQFAEKATFFGGMTYQFIGITPLGSPQPTYASLYGLGAGMDYVLLHSNDVVSLGVNPNVNLCLQFSSYYGLSFFGNVPVYMLARVGAGATKFNEQKVGIGAGIGGSYSYLYSNSGSGALSTSFINPGAIVEFALRTRASNYLFRFNWSLLKPTRTLEYGTSSFDARVGVLGLGIFYNF
jgi:hypothetical protein